MCSTMRVTGVVLHTPTGLHHHNPQPPVGGFRLAPEPATGWQNQNQNQPKSFEHVVREDLEGEDQQRVSQHQQQQLETVGEKLGQLQKSLLAKQSYLAKVRMEVMVEVLIVVIIVSANQLTLVIWICQFHVP